MKCQTCFLEINIENKFNICRLLKVLHRVPRIKKTILLPLSMILTRIPKKFATAYTTTLEATHTIKIVNCRFQDDVIILISFAVNCLDY